MTPALEVKNLTVKYSGDSQIAVEDVTFEVSPDTVAMLIGPNGCGKTTVIKAVLGLVGYDGEIKVFGEPVSKMYSKIGYVPQRFSFDRTFPITVFEFVSLVLATHSSKNLARKVKQTLEYVGADTFAKKKMSTLSGGQLQRVLLARALVKDPKLLLLDEPEAGVDVGGEQTFYDLVERLVDQKNVTAIIASHELDIVYTYAQQVICLNRKMLCAGVPKKVLNQQTFEKLYGRGLKFYGHDHAHHSHKGGA
jgi:ABC-type Mn2+/Zn2+ transport system ATPase subunit